MPAARKARNKRKTHKAKNGPRKHAGRFVLSSHHIARVFLVTLLTRTALILAVAILASSTITDPLASLAREGISESQRVASGQLDFSSLHQLERLALLRRIAGDADSVRHLSLQNLILVFGEPNLIREEKRAVSYQFTSSECALDVYFPREGKSQRRHPVYAEYRVREKATDSAKARVPDHRDCVKSLFSHARQPSESFVLLKNAAWAG